MPIPKKQMWSKMSISVALSTGSENCSLLVFFRLTKKLTCAMLFKCEPVSVTSRDFEPETTTSALRLRVWAHSSSTLICHFHSQTVWLRLCLQSDFTFSEKLLKVPPCEHFQHCLIFLQLLPTKVFVWLSWRFYFLAFGQKISPMTRCPLNFRSPAVEDDSRLCISYSRRKKDILQSFDFDFSAVSPLIENNKSEIYWSFNLQFCLNFLQSFL